MGFKYFLPVKDELNGIFYGRNKNKITFYTEALSNEIVTSGLILNLDAGNSSSYSGSGSTWFDISGNNNDFTISGATYSGAYGGSFTFGDDEGDYILRSATDVIGGLTDLTVEMWIRIQTLPTQLTFISCNTSSTDNAFMVFKVSANTIRAYLGASNVNTTFSDSNWNTGSYINFVIARSGTNIKYYIDGTFITETNSYFSGSIATGGTLVFGQEQDSPGGGFNTAQDFPGDYAKIAIYNRQLSASEVQQNYDALKDRFTETVVTSGLQLYLDAGDSSSYPGSGTTWYDLSGNGRNFTWNSVSFTSGSIPYFSTLGNKATGPASNSFGINNTSGYTIFLIMMQNTLSNSGAFEFHSSTATYNRGIFSHCTWSDDIVYFDQGGCCGSDTRVQVASGGSQTWNIWTFRRFTNSSTRTISKNGSTLITNTASAANINLSTTGASVGGTASYTNWNARLGGFIVYNRGLSDAEVTQNFNALKGRYGL